MLRQEIEVAKASQGTYTQKARRSIERMGPDDNNADYWMVYVAIAEIRQRAYEAAFREQCDG
jgi:hypothetical protein